MFDLTGRTAIVTGASEGGIGQWTALALARHGADVILSDAEECREGLVSTKQRLAGTGRRVETVIADVTRPEDVQALVDAAVASTGRLDILVNHAGIMLRKDAHDTTLEEWERVISVNLTGTFLLDRAAAMAMADQGGGAIINTSTVYANIVGEIPEASYYASKAGVANLTRGLAMEWGAQGIRVNCLAPGVFYPTRMTGPLAETQLEAMRGRTMLGRLGEPDSDLGGTVVWLASDASKYVTGQVIHVDGGWSAK